MEGLKARFPSGCKYWKDTAAQGRHHADYAPKFYRRDPGGRDAAVEPPGEGLRPVPPANARCDTTSGAKFYFKKV